MLCIAHEYKSHKIKFRVQYVDKLTGKQSALIALDHNHNK